MFSWEWRNGWKLRDIGLSSDYFSQRCWLLKSHCGLLSWKLRPSDQHVVTQAHLPFGICPWLLRNSNRTFPHDLNEVFSWDLQGQRSRFGRLPWIHTHLKTERINMIVSWLFWLFSLALHGLIFRKMEEFSNTGWADGSDVGESPYIKGRIMFNAGGNRSSSFQEILVR